MKNLEKSWLLNQYIAHRGLHNKEFPENSLPAFENAKNKGFAIECDVHLTKDNQIVVFHDMTTGRLTNVDGVVKDMTLKELKELKLNNSNFSIPTLEEVLKVVDGSVPLLIEIKGFSKKNRLEKLLYETMLKYKGDYAVQSFNPFSITWFRKNAPEVIRGQLSSSFKNRKMSRLRKFVLSKMLLNPISRPDFVAYNYEDLLQETDRITKLPILAWTVRTKEDQENLLNLCDNIIFEGFIPKRY